ncbi:type IV secretory system conjugative DNA transfer VirD4/TraG family protein [Mucilaginibacter gracilis]|uniref:Type IV secretory system conjugative DNA transfer VirD4/TraG family protein n=1 Tax=Mucilaginibacter gracilis TaxID=423350 RepID=A0A495J358_9SPHI|nr:conjugal transfer protein MobC [Mucilaginibacter gracilis]RKR83400.1 type IV secretory system conjugative DNA transfer VirD4/TraG family protein [Mucilaginibacter gracilis]
MQTGEDSQGLRKIIDFTRLISLFILSIHFYISCYAAFQAWHLTAEITTRIVLNIGKTGLFMGMLKPKLAALVFLLISLIGAKGKKEEKIRKDTIAIYLGAGLLLYFISGLSFYLIASPAIITISYIGLTALGYLLILTGGVRLSRLISLGLTKDIFNTENETFPQEERLLENEYSVNLPARYALRKKIRSSWINFINPFRGLLVVGTPGAGKSYFVIRHVIDQHLKKGFSMFIYDFKFDDLTKIAYNKLIRYKENFKVKPQFYLINFDDLSRTHRSNPLDPQSMEDITDATEASRTILLGLNRDWIKKQGEFFVESPINFLTAIIWYLRRYRDGRYCTLPHVIELMQADYEELFPLLKEEEEIKVLINPFISAYQNKATDQLEGQVASAKISLARLSSPQLYYVLSGNDFTLDINNPLSPKIVCMGNNPQKLQTYGAVLSLYISRVIKLANRKNQLKSSLIFDEFPTIYFNNIDSLIATARSNKVSTTLGIQDYSQLKKDYGREQAEVIMNIVGNIISGQVTGDTAKQLSERLGKIMQERNSVSINSSDTSVSKSTQLEYAVPASKISSLSSGSFVGMVADNPDEKIELKIFHSEIQNDHAAIKAEEDNYQPIPAVANVSTLDVEENYKTIKAEIADLIEREIGILTARKEALDAAKQEVKKHAEAEIKPTAVTSKEIIETDSKKPGKRQSRKEKRMLTQRKKIDKNEQFSEEKPLSR